MLFIKILKQNMINVNSLLKNALKILIIVLNVKVLFIENNCFSNCSENTTEREGICLSCVIYELSSVINVIMK